MPISEIPIFSMLRTKLQWHQERQRVLAENVANADTPEFKPSDLAPPNFDAATSGMAPVTLVRTNPAHLASADAGGGQFDLQDGGPFEVVPTGNAVNLDDEMLKIASNQMDFQAATELYTRGLSMIRTAIAK